MRVEFDASGTEHGLARILNLLCDDPATGGILVLACDGNGFTPDLIDPILTTVKKPIIGGVFPYVLYGTSHHRLGTVAIGFPGMFHVGVVTDLSKRATDIDSVMSQLFDPTALGRAATMVAMADGLSTAVSKLVDLLFATFGMSLNFIGGGAGSLSLKQSPCILTGEGMLADAAALALTQRRSSIGVSHGWSAISEPLRVTASDGNIVDSLDGRPALDAYAEIVEAHSGHPLPAENFFDTAKAYPLGITRLGGELIVRDPLRLQGTSLVCVGEVQVGSFVRVLHGTPAKLIAAACAARDEALLGARDLDDVSISLFIDCVSRVLFLGDQFGDELAQVYSEGVPLVGALTIGEIANSGREYLEFYNKTAVVGLF